MDNEHLWNLLARKKCGEATLEELRELEDLLSRNRQLDSGIEMINRVWETPLNTDPSMSLRPNSWDSVNKKINASGGKIVSLNARTKQSIPAAAVIAILMSTALYFYVQQGRENNVGPNDKFNTVSTQPASKSKIQLPDGTTVWLNSNSKLIYNTATFGIKGREVTLTGEAFFDVVKNEKIPFILHAGDINIKVKGTAFNVNAYPDQHNVRTSLIRGLIEITTVQEPDRKILLKANEKIVIPSGVLTKALPDTTAGDNSLYLITKLQKSGIKFVPDTVWMKDNLKFENETFADLALQLESWFSVKILFNDEVIRRRRFSGIIEKETLVETLSAMQLSYAFTYTIEGNEIRISKK